MDDEGRRVWRLVAARDSVTVVATGQYYESSRLLLTKQWAEIAALTKATIIAAVPGHDTLLFILDPSQATIHGLPRAIQMLEPKLERPLSRTLLRWTSGGWQVQEP